MVKCKYNLDCLCTKCQGCEDVEFYCDECDGNPEDCKFLYCTSYKEQEPAQQAAQLLTTFTAPAGEVIRNEPNK